MATNITSSPADLFQTAAGLPLLLTLAVLVLHATCYVIQLSCGAGEDGEADGILSPRDALHDSIARGGRGGRGDKAPLLPGSAPGKE